MFGQFFGYLYNRITENVYALCAGNNFWRSIHNRDFNYRLLIQKNQTL